MNKGTELKGILGHVNKEIEAFSKEKQALDELYDVAGNIKNLEDDYIILKQALTELKQIKGKFDENKKSDITSLSFTEFKEIHKNDTPIVALDILHRLSLAPDYVKPKSVEEMARRFLRDKVEQTLQRLEALENSKPSEALECLERIIITKPYKTFDEFDNDYNSIKQYILKAQEQEKALADVEKVKSGKTIIHIGKDLVMMNKAKYYEYVELEEEPVSKRILQAKCEEQAKVLEIIKEKNVNLLVLRNCTKVEEYNKRIIEWQGQDKLTKEEFNTLKEMLK